MRLAPILNKLKKPKIKNPVQILKERGLPCKRGETAQKTGCIPNPRKKKSGQTPQEKQERRQHVLSTFDKLRNNERLTNADFDKLSESVLALTVEQLRKGLGVLGEKQAGAKSVLQSRALNALKKKIELGQIDIQTEPEEVPEEVQPPEQIEAAEQAEQAQTEPEMVQGELDFGDPDAEPEPEMVQGELDFGDPDAEPEEPQTVEDKVDALSDKIDTNTKIDEVMNRLDELSEKIDSMTGETDEQLPEDQEQETLEQTAEEAGPAEPGTEETGAEPDIGGTAEPEDGGAAEEETGVSGDRESLQNSLGQATLNPSEEEGIALSKYTGISYFNLNQQLRENNGDASKLDEDYAPMYAQLQSLFDKVPVLETPIAATRGMRLDSAESAADYIQQLRQAASEGKRLQADTIFSTSVRDTNDALAREYSGEGSPNADSGILFEIESNKGIYVPGTLKNDYENKGREWNPDAIMDMAGTIEKEQEFLINNGTQFEIGEISERPGGGYTVQLKQVETDANAESIGSGYQKPEEAGVEAAPAETPEVIYPELYDRASAIEKPTPSDLLETSRQIADLYPGEELHRPKLNYEEITQDNVTDVLRELADTDRPLLDKLTDTGVIPYNELFRSLESRWKTYADSDVNPERVNQAMDATKNEFDRILYVLEQSGQSPEVLDYYKAGAAVIPIVRNLLLERTQANREAINQEAANREENQKREAEKRESEKVKNDYVSRLEQAYNKLRENGMSGNLATIFDMDGRLSYSNEEVLNEALQELQDRGINISREGAVGEQLNAEQEAEPEEQVAEGITEDNAAEPEMEQQADTQQMEAEESDPVVNEDILDEDVDIEEDYADYASYGGRDEDIVPQENLPGTTEYTQDSFLTDVGQGMSLQELQSKYGTDAINQQVGELADRGYLKLGEGSRTPPKDGNYIQIGSGYYTDFGLGERASGYGQTSKFETADGEPDLEEGMAESAFENYKAPEYQNADPDNVMDVARGYLSELESGKSSLTEFKDLLADVDPDELDETLLQLRDEGKIRLLTEEESGIATEMSIDAVKDGDKRYTAIEMVTEAADQIDGTEETQPTETAEPEQVIEEPVEKPASKTDASDDYYDNDEDYVIEDDDRDVPPEEDDDEEASFVQEPEQQQEQEPEKEEELPPPLSTEGDREAGTGTLRDTLKDRLAIEMGADIDSEEFQQELEKREQNLKDKLRERSDGDDTEYQRLLEEAGFTDNDAEIAQDSGAEDTISEENVSVDGTYEYKSGSITDVDSANEELKRIWSALGDRRDNLDHITYSQVETLMSDLKKLSWSDIKQVASQFNIHGIASKKTLLEKIETKITERMSKQERGQVIADAAKAEQESAKDSPEEEADVEVVEETSEVTEQSQQDTTEEESDIEVEDDTETDADVVDQEKIPVGSYVTWTNSAGTKFQGKVLTHVANGNYSVRTSRGAIRNLDPSKVELTPVEDGLHYHYETTVADKESAIQELEKVWSLLDSRESESDYVTFPQLNALLEDVSKLSKKDISEIARALDLDGKGSKKSMLDRIKNKYKERMLDQDKKRSEVQSDKESDTVEEQEQPAKQEASDRDVMQSLGSLFADSGIDGITPKELRDALGRPENLDTIIEYLVRDGAITLGRDDHPALSTKEERENSIKINGTEYISIRPTDNFDQKMQEILNSSPDENIDVQDDAVPESVVEEQSSAVDGDLDMDSEDVTGEAMNEALDQELHNMLSSVEGMEYGDLPGVLDSLSTPEFDQKLQDFVKKMKAAELKKLTKKLTGSTRQPKSKAEALEMLQSYFLPFNKTEPVTGDEYSSNELVSKYDSPYIGKEAFPDLQEEEAAILDDYTATAYNRVNRSLLDAKGDISKVMKSPGVSEKAKRHIKALKKAFSKAKKLPKPITTWRGLHFHSSKELQNFIDQIKTGEKFVADTFLSTSTDEEVAKTFTFPSTENVMFEIEADKGLYMPSVVARRYAKMNDTETLENGSLLGFGEKEFLIDHSSEFEVVSMEKGKKGIHHIKLRQITE